MFDLPKKISWILLKHSTKLVFAVRNAIYCIILYAGIEDENNVSTESIYGTVLTALSFSKFFKKVYIKSYFYSKFVKHLKLI